MNMVRDGVPGLSAGTNVQRVIRIREAAGQSNSPRPSAEAL